MKLKVQTLMSLAGLSMCLFSCASSGNDKNEAKEEPEIDRTAMAEMRGVWLDSYSESPVLKIHNDSICFASQSNVSMPFIVRNDSILILGLQTTAYPIIKRTADFLSFINSAGDKISLIKGTDESIIPSSDSRNAASTPAEVVKKDSVIMYKNERYRGYSYINPTSIKIIRPGITEDGFTVDNVYFDNIIHICVYKGKKRLCGKDIKKEQFKNIVPDDFLNSSILGDMDFIGVNAEGYRFMATVCMPDGPCYNIELTIDDENNVNIKPVNWQ